MTRLHFGTGGERSLRRPSHRAPASALLAGWVPVLTTSIALASLIATVVLQNQALHLQADLKRYEVTFRPKQQAYAEFMRQLFTTFEAAVSGVRPLVRQSLDSMDSTYTSLEPFLTPRDRERIWGQHLQFQALCLSLLEEREKGQLPKERLDKFYDSLIWYRGWFRTNLFAALFPSGG